jgi:hypothetical protein
LRSTTRFRSAGCRVARISAASRSWCARTLSGARGAPLRRRAWRQTDSTASTRAARMLRSDPGRAIERAPTVEEVIEELRVRLTLVALRARDDSEDARVCGPSATGLGLPMVLSSRLSQRTKRGSQARPDGSPAPRQTRPCGPVPAPPLRTSPCCPRIPGKPSATQKRSSRHGCRTAGARRRRSFRAQGAKSRTF